MFEIDYVRHLSYFIYYVVIIKLYTRFLVNKLLIQVTRMFTKQKSVYLRPETI